MTAITVRHFEHVACEQTNPEKDVVQLWQENPVLNLALYSTLPETLAQKALELHSPVKIWDIQEPLSFPSKTSESDHALLRLFTQRSWAIDVSKP